jgi:hypothetical protein
VKVKFGILLDMILKVIKADYINDYSIKLKFNNGNEKVVNLKNELFGEVFEPLNDLIFFKNFIINCNTISWSNGADFAPEFLYDL